MFTRPFRKVARLSVFGFVLIFSAGAIFAQTTAFTYQGRLTDGGTPANGSYDLQFALWDSLSGGTQIGSTQTVSSVSVSNGIFTVQLDFGVNAFPGANRFLEIGVRLAGSGNPFTILTPRQQITSTPYAVRSLGSTSADALSSACVGCVTVANGGTGATSFTANAPLIGNGTGAVSVGSRSGNTTTFATTNGALTSSHCVQIDSGGNLVDSGAACGGGGGGGLPDPGSNGIVVRTATNATVARSLAAGTPLAITNADGTTGNPTINLAGVVPTANGGTGLGSPGASGNFLKSNGSAWTSAALSSADIPSGSGSYIQNTMSTQSSSNFNISGTGTAGGTLSGNVVNATAQYNIGGNRFASAPGLYNAFVGLFAGQSNTGSANSFFGYGAGAANTTANGNCFFGYNAGANNTGGIKNTFVGTSAGISNTTEAGNTFIGGLADGFLASGPGITNATAIGANSLVTQSNSLVLGSINGVNLANADTNVGIGTTAPGYKLQIIDASNTGLRVQTNTTGGTVASFGGNGDFQVDAPGIVGGRFIVKEGGSVGIGTAAPRRTLDVEGGDILIGGAGQGFILKSPNGLVCRRVTIDNNGNILVSSIPCP